MAVSTILTYRQYLNFIRKQGPGGCFIYATLTIMDILFQKKYGNKFAPNLSYAFAAYFYKSTHIYNPKTKKEDIVNPFQGNHLQVLKKYGCYPESMMPTNYDRGDLIPNMSQIKYAQKFKIEKWGGLEKPKSKKQIDYDFVKKIKDYLYTYGPILASIYRDAGDVKENYCHVVAIIGFNDNNKEFEYVNSYGDRFGISGIGQISYSAFLGSKIYPQIYDIQWIKIKSSKKARFIGSAQINIITHSDPMPNGAEKLYGRNVLVIRLGRIGKKTSMVIWDRNNSYRGAGTGRDHTLNVAAIWDDSTTLLINVPLPNYKILRDWFLEIENHSVSEQNNYFSSVRAELFDFKMSEYNGQIRNCSTKLPLWIYPGQIGRAEIKR